MTKMVDWFVQALVAATFLVMLFAPQKWGGPAALISFAVVGIWALLFPQGILGWAKTAHRSIQVDDRSIWWIPRLIGTCFVILVLLIMFIAFRR